MSHLNRQLLRELNKAGATVSRTKKCHYRITNPENGKFFFTGSSSGDRLAQHKARSDARRIGIDLGDRKR